MSVDGNNRNIPENEIRVKGFLILEVKDNPNVWGRKGSGVPGRLAGMRSLSEDWKAILLNMREAFKNDPELLAKYKVDTVSGLKNTWENLFEAHRRKWANKIEKNDSTGAREWPFYHSLEFIRLSMSEPWPSDKLMRCEKCSFTTNRGDKMTLHKKSKHWNNGNKKKYMCHECGFKAFSQIFLNDHINVVHLNKKLHNCDQCDYTTGWTSSLVTHKKIHQPDHIGRKYMCDQCTRKFRAQMKLREHVDAVHLKKKPFKCGVGDCDWITGFQGNVMVHKRKVHGFTAVQKPGRYPRAEIVEQSEEGKESPQDNDGEEQKLEIKEALIKEVKKHPQIWDTTHHQQGNWNLHCKEDWDDIWTNLERAFMNNKYFHNLFPGDTNVLSKYTKVPFSHKEASIKKIKYTWLHMVQRYKRLVMKKSSTFDTDCTDGSDENQVVDWPLYESLKFLSEIKSESSDKPNEPQIFKDVRKYVQQRRDEGEKDVTVGNQNDRV